MSIYMQTRNEWDVANPVWYRLLGRILGFDVWVFKWEPLRGPGAVCVLLVSPGQNFVTTPRSQATDVTPVPRFRHDPGAKVSFQPTDVTPVPRFRHDPGAKVSFQPTDVTPVPRYHSNLRTKLCDVTPGAKPLTSPQEPSHWRHPGAKVSFQPPDKTLWHDPGAKV